MLVEKEIIRPGTYWYRDQDTGTPRKLVVTPELTKHWNDQGNAMLSSGLTVPVPFEHDFNAHPMSPADKLLNNAGWVKEYKRHDGTPQKGPGDRLFGVVDVQDADVAKKLPGTIRWTSPWINSFTDGNGKTWNNVISHLALTTRPRIVEQAPFGSVAAALSMAEDVSLSVSRDDHGRFSVGDTVRFEGQSADGIVSGGMDVKVIDPHSNKHEISKEEGKGKKKRYYDKEGHTHIPKAIVERPEMKRLSGDVVPAKRFEAHHHTLSNKTMGFSLSNAGLLDGAGQPVYPMAFSLLSDGITLNTEHDKATGQFTGAGKSGGKDKSHYDHLQEQRQALTKVASDLEDHHISKDTSHDRLKKHRQALTKIASQLEGNPHPGAREAEKHVDNARHGLFQAEGTSKPAHEAAGDAMKHVDAARHHIHGIPMALDAALGFPPPKGKKKPGATHPPKPGASKIPPDEDDSDADGIGDEDDLDEDGDGETDDGNIDLEPFNDPAGDVQMEELLCDLLGALGINVEHTGGAEMFKRSLYNAAMTKIHELASKGDANKDPTKGGNRTNPPGQPPNNPQQKPGGQPNPLIQQEQQPMYMSLEEINKLPDPAMKGVALAMYNENVKLRAEMDGDRKKLNSLNDAKLKEENAKRTARVQLLGKLSPRVKGDLDTMLALPGMALSMGDGGAVVDPMAQTLAVLEKGLSDMPRLLTTEHTQLSIQPQPTDGEMSAEETDKIADDMARRMGCPPEQKKAG